MAKLKKTLGSKDSPCIVQIKKLIETQAKAAVAHFAIDYAEQNFLPIYYKSFPNDNRLQITIDGARAWLRGEVKFPYAKNLILNSCHAAARECADNPPAQAAARAVGQACSSIHVAEHCLGICFYGAAAIAYDRIGINESKKTYEKIAEEIHMEVMVSLIKYINIQHIIK